MKDNFTGGWLKESRMSLGLSQAALGSRLGLSRVMIGLMERGRPIEPRTGLSVWCLLYEAGIEKIGEFDKTDKLTLGGSL